MVPVTAMGEIKVIGIQVRTRNADEADPAKAKIARLWGRFFRENIKGRVPNPTDPDTVVAVYSDYESDENGMYTLTVGLQVGVVKDIPQGLSAKICKPSKYAFFRTSRGPVPDVLIQTWKEVWSVNEKELGGKRSFTADFEFYDDRSRDPKNASVDVYVGIR